MHGNSEEQQGAGPVGVVLVSVVTLMGLCAVIAGLWPVEPPAEVGEGVVVSLVRDDVRVP